MDTISRDSPVLSSDETAESTCLINVHLWKVRESCPVLCRPLFLKQWLFLVLVKVIAREACSRKVAGSLAIDVGGAAGRT